MKKNNAKEEIKEAIDKIKWFAINLFRENIPKKLWVVVVFIVAIVVIVFSGIVFVNFASSQVKTFKEDILGINTEDENPMPDFSPSPTETEHPIKKRLDDERVSNKCLGAIFNPILDFEEIGGERFYFENENNLEVSARKTKNYQAAVRTQWYCRMPFVAQLRLYPVSGKSLGVFLEYENAFLTLLGDGDRKTLKLQENRYAIRDKWIDVFEKKLVNLIEDGEEVLLTVMAKEVGNKIEVKIEVWHSKFQNKEEYSASFVPNINFGGNQSRRFRIGINDSFYKGEGSVVKFDTFSVIEKEW